MPRVGNINGELEFLWKIISWPKAADPLSICPCFEQLPTLVRPAAAGRGLVLVRRCAHPAVPQGRCLACGSLHRLLPETRALPIKVVFFHLAHVRYVSQAHVPFQQFWLDPVRSPCKYKKEFTR